MDRELFGFLADGDDDGVNVVSPVKNVSASAWTAASLVEVSLDALRCFAIIADNLALRVDLKVIGVLCYLPLDKCVRLDA